MDTLDRVAVIVINEGDILLGHAPNVKRDGQTWDLPKGHIAEGEKPSEAAIRELKEETGIEINATDLIGIGSTNYKSGKIYFYKIELDHRPEDLTCNTFFEMWGKKLPEFNAYQWAPIPEVQSYLYKGLYKAFSNFIEEI